MKALFDVATRLSRKFYQASDDDWACRLNRLGTVLIFLSASTLIGLHPFVNLIDCWGEESSSSNPGYVKDICWISNTYELAWSDQIPSWPAMTPKEPSREKRELNYYQWLSFLISFQCVLLYLPHILWRILNSVTGLHLKEVMKIGYKSDAQKAVIAKHLNHYIGLRHLGDTTSPDEDEESYANCCGRAGGWLYPLFMLVKLFYLGNIILQMFILVRIVGGHHLLAPAYMVGDYMSGGNFSYQAHGIFPKVTLCDFLVRRVGNLHRHTVQCTLPVNMYNEKIILILWIWLVIVGIVNVYSMASWLASVAIAPIRRRWFLHHLDQIGLYRERHRHRKAPADQALVSDTEIDVRRYRHFVNSYLSTDGVFVLQLLESNTSAEVTQDVLMHLWKVFLTINEFSTTA